MAAGGRLGGLALGAAQQLGGGVLGLRAELRRAVGLDVEEAEEDDDEDEIEHDELRARQLSDAAARGRPVLRGEHSQTY